MSDDDSRKVRTGDEPSFFSGRGHTPPAGNTSAKSPTQHLSVYSVARYLKKAQAPQAAKNAGVEIVTRLAWWFQDVRILFSWGIILDGLVLLRRAIIGSSAAWVPIGLCSIMAIGVLVKFIKGDTF